MIEIDAGPAGCLVAILAYIRGWNMGGGFARGGGAIVTAETGPCDRAVIKAHPRPICGHMAIFTPIA